MASPGRPRKSEKYGGHIVAAQDLIADRLPCLIRNMFELADGVTVEEPMPNGGVRVYSRAPDRQANEYLINRIMGKPIERHEHSGEDGDPLFGGSLDRLDAHDLDNLETIADKLLAGESGAAEGGDPGGAGAAEPD
jgi:hypothetical protein